MKKRIIALLMGCLLLCTGCAAPPVETQPTAVVTTAPAEVTAAPADTEPAETEPAETEPAEIRKELVVYFAYWYLDTNTAQEGAEVCSIPWDKVTYVNHAFWEVQPDDGSAETSWEQRDSGKGPRTKFRIASTLEEADFENQEPSTMVPDLPRNHFAQYAVYAEKYPEVNILISIGGWTRCGYFSEMAYTPEGRTSFVESCMALMEEYPWIDGFDIDWEYFGGSKDGERKPEDDNDQGCPIWGTVEEDSENFGLLAQELRQAMDDAYGPGVKKLTACASGSTGWTLPMQNWRKVAPYMDLVNVMTYDMAGVWDGITGHASRGQHVKDAITVMQRGYHVDLPNICVGTPMYGTDLKMLKAPADGNAVGMLIETTAPADFEVTQEMIRQWESEAVSGYNIDWVDGKPVMGETFDNGGTGWHFGFDEFARGAYMYNDDENSEYYLWYISYENPITLQDKLDLVEERGIAGLIVWECSEDTYDHQMISQMYDNLFKN